MRLVKFKSDHSDEFDVFGFRIMNQKELTKFKEAVKQLFETRDHVEIYFGPNEAIEFESYDEVMRCFEIIEIDVYETHTLKRLFRRYNNPGYFGWTPIDQLLDKAGEDIE